ncbi:MAG: ATP-dependent Clp protease ATP-binding subunit ClpX [bacterium]
MRNGTRRAPAKPKSCSFCGAPGTAERRLVISRRSAICETCARAAGNAFSAARPEPVETLPAELPKPADIRGFLDNYVIGQERAKKVVSVAVYNHYKRVRARKNAPDLGKSNILMIGPTGVGKTLIAETLARFLHVPFSISDATPLTEAGYVGEDVENVLLRLLQAADFDSRRAETGIVYIDEVDKIARRADSPSITRDVSGEGVQQALLKIIEGTIASVPPAGGRKHPEQQYIKLDTRGILFICGGTFDGLERIIERRVRTSALGFGADLAAGTPRGLDELLPLVAPEDLIHYGLIPEFVGRLPVTTTLHSLSASALVDIMTRPRNALVRQYSYYFELEGVKLTFTPEALQAAAELAAARKTGARALRTIIEEAMLDIMFELPSLPDVAEVIITPAAIRKEQPPELVRGRLAARKAQ